MNCLPPLFWRRSGRFSLALLLGVCAAGWLIQSMSGLMSWSTAVTVRYVAPAPAGNDTSNDCSSPTAPCATLQQAIDQAHAGDEIRLATGVYQDVTTHNSLTQIGYIDKALTVRGGYDAVDFSSVQAPANQTILDPQESGRGLVITGSIVVTVEQLTIQNGSASGQGGDDVADFCDDAGGGIFVQDAAISISNSHILSSTACEGGGIYLLNSPQLTMESSAINYNTAYDYAGGIYLKNSSNALLYQVELAGNVANQAAGGVKNCGGMRIYESEDVQIENAVIRDNVTANSGGGLCIDASDSVRVADSQIVGNMRKPSFVGFGVGVRIESSSNIVLWRNLISRNGGENLDNIGAIIGGGISSRNSTLTLYGNTITDNVATHGGGVYLGGSKPVTATANLIQSNTVYTSAVEPTNSGLGGGVYAKDLTFTASSMVIADNQVGFPGTPTGLFTEDSNVTLLHPTIVRHEGGSGISFAGVNQSLAIVNGIVATHTVGIRITGSNMVTIDGILWFNNAQNRVGGSPPTNAFTADPRFAPDEYHLTAVSPAINKGTAVAAGVDIDLAPRPACVSDPFLDLGADEFACYFLYLPIVYFNPN